MKNPDIWASGRVTRWHSNPVMNVHYQTNADHQWGVAALCLVLHPNPSPELLRDCLFHDCGEIGPGDVSYLAKRNDPELAVLVGRAEEYEHKRMGTSIVRLPESEVVWREMCDRLESVRFVRLREPQLLEDDDWQAVIRGIMAAAQTLGVEDKVLEVLAG